MTLAKIVVGVLFFTFGMVALFYVLAALAHTDGVVGKISAYVLGSIVYELSQSLIMLVIVIAGIAAVCVVGGVQIVASKMRRNSN